ncbi:hypothetical protein VIGAN_01201100 [Vigna angularis var. angularis]|uniref:Uncharacterized protein n=1 Tax=Vigna angularis var. angularis TaxID=157739 RepID=A0A0S3R130_PHAAN|nr:hypothetical protein VIGAN_01201100 [Vigna angularis var. angularis]
MQPENKDTNLKLNTLLQIKSPHTLKAKTNCPAWWIGSCVHFLFMWQPTMWLTSIEISPSMCHPSSRVIIFQLHVLLSSIPCFTISSSFLSFFQQP